MFNCGDSLCLGVYNVASGLVAIMFAWYIPCWSGLRVLISREIRVRVVPVYVFRYVPVWYGMPSCLVLSVFYRLSCSNFVHGLSGYIPVWYGMSLFDSVSMGGL